MNSSEESRIDKLRRLLGTGGDARSSMARLSTDGAMPIEQTQMAPDGLEWLEDVSHACWIEESLSDFGTRRSMLPRGFPSYARIFHSSVPDNGVRTGLYRDTPPRHPYGRTNIPSKEDNDGQGQHGHSGAIATQLLQEVIHGTASLPSSLQVFPGTPIGTRLAQDTSPAHEPPGCCFPCDQILDIALGQESERPTLD